MSSSQHQQPTRHSSVNDYVSQEPLRQTLCGCDNLDWMLTSYDPNTTQVQSMQDELQRLKVLKSYMILDTQPEEDFERITRLATRVFNVPICLVSLVDLGRQWFKSNRGLAPAVRETSRSVAFCAHAIQSKMDCLVVPDTLQDFRFRENALVVGSPYIRFYAGAPLICPEGYKLGALCVLDSKPRTGGLTQDESETLKDLATMVVKVMVDRRERLLEKQEDPAKLIAHTAHDLQTPLSAVQLSLSLLKDDPTVADALNAKQVELITTASTCSEMMVRICQASVESLRHRRQEQSLSGIKKNHDTTCVPGDDRQDREPLAVTMLPDLVQGLRTVLKPIPVQVPVIITLDPDTPKAVMSDDLKLFRSALNLLSNAIARTQRGKVHMRIFVHEQELVFECEDTSDVVVTEAQQRLLLQPGAWDDERELEFEVDVGLAAMVSHVKSLHGTYGVRSRETIENDQGESIGNHQCHKGLIFWIRIPLQVAPANHKDGENVLLPLSPNQAAKIPNLHDTLGSSGSCNSIVSLGSSCIIHTPQNNEAGVESTDNCVVATLRDKLVSGDSADTLVQAYTIGDGGSAAAARAGEVHQYQQAARSRSASFSGALSPPTLPRMKRALIIEDSLVIRKTLERALSKLGFVVSQAVNGLEGLEKLKEILFDFVLLDFLMPVMDGLDCVKQYRDWENENRPCFRQWIVGISAHVSVEASEQGFRAGMDGFFPKPISIKTLEAIQNSKAVLARNNLLDELEDTTPQRKKASFLKDITCYDDCPSDSTTSATTARSDNDVTDYNERHQDVSSVRVCLIAVATATKSPTDLVDSLLRKGWQCSLSRGGKDALRQLQTRNWDVVLLTDSGGMGSSSDDLLAVRLVREFRTWETKNRVNEQKNIYLVCDNDDLPDPRDPNSVVQPPSGFNGAIRKSAALDDLKYMMKTKKTTNSNEHELNIVVCR